MEVIALLKQEKKNMFDWSDEEALSSLVMPVSSLHLHNENSPNATVREPLKSAETFEAESVRSSVDMAETQSASKFVMNIKNFLKTNLNDRNDSDSNEAEISSTKFESFERGSGNFSSNMKNFPRTPKQAVECMIFGRPYCLDIFQSFEDKLTLLSAANLFYNSTVTVKIVLFLRNTLNCDLFYQIISQFPFALNEYKAYLKQTDSHYELKHLQKNLNLLDYFQYKFEKISKIAHVQTKIYLLEKLISNKLFKAINEKLTVSKISDLVLIEESNLFNTSRESHLNSELVRFLVYTKEYIFLLKNQLCLFGPQKILMEEFEKSTASHPLVTNNINFWFALDDSLMKTAKYAVFQQIQNRPLLPQPLKEEYNLSDKQFEWLLVICFVAMGYFSSLNMIFERNENSLFKNKILKKLNTAFKTNLTSHVGFEHVACYLFEVGSYLKMIDENINVDDAQICLYINAIANENVRLYIAEHCERFDILIEIITQNRDLFTLQQKMSYIKHERFVSLAREALNKNIKWKQ